MVPVAVKVGDAPIFTVTLSVAVQPLASVTVTIYVVLLVGLTVLLAPAPKPLFHMYVYGLSPPEPLAVSIIEDPVHIVASAPALTVGEFVILMVTASKDVQPALSVIVTV